MMGSCIVNGGGGIAHRSPIAAYRSPTQLSSYPLFIRGTYLFESNLYTYLPTYVRGSFSTSYEIAR